MRSIRVELRINLVYSLLHMLSNINLLVDSFYSIIYLSPCNHVVTHPLVSLVKEAVLYVSSLQDFGSMKSDNFLGIQDPSKSHKFCFPRKFLFRQQIRCSVSFGMSLRLVTSVPSMRNMCVNSFLCMLISLFSGITKSPMALFSLCFRPIEA